MKNPQFSEDTLSEQPLIEQLRDRLGYIYIHGDELDPELKDECERSSRKEVVLVERLKKKLAEINNGLTEETIDKAVRKITHIKEEGTFEANRIFHQKLISGDSIEQDIGARRQNVTVKFIDFDNPEKNDFLVVNQFWVKGPKEHCRPDVVIFINGIPIVVIECKSPVAKNTGTQDALVQLIRYQKDIPQLFITNEMLIGCNLFNAKYGVIEAGLEHFHEWKDKGNEHFVNMQEHSTVKQMLEDGLIDKKELGKDPVMQEVLVASVLKKQNLLDILQNFIVFDYSKEEHKVIKKICRYQQFIAVNKIVKRVTDETDKRGIIWHWQGSGKSLIMIFAAMKLRRKQKELENPIILIATDRRGLDQQITENFQNCNFPNPNRAESMKDLYDMLRVDVGGTIMTTVQKFRVTSNEPLSKAANIIVMTDEAHRTQYGNFAFNLRKALPNASFFAFTGTPLNKRDRNTYRHFSPAGEWYLDRYTPLQSVEDGATVSVKYQSRLVKLQVVGASIDKLLRELFADKNKEELAEIKKRYVTVDAILESPRRIERVAMDIVNHYNEKIAPNGFKAMLVASSRAAAIKYKEELDKLIGASASTVIITVNNDDPQEWKDKYRRTDKEEEKITGKDEFQDQNNPLKFLIVCDKLLTGFDAPILQVMYLDQRMKEHTLLQAVARTNRPYSRKNFGLVVDYVGVGKELAKALAIFDKEDLEGLFSVDDLKKELEYLKEHHKNAMAFFKKVDFGDEPKNILQRCLEIIEPEDVRVAFEKSFRDFARSMDILMPDLAVEPYLKDFKFLGSVYQGAKNLYRDARFSLENCSKKVEQLIHAHIRDIGVEEILEPIHITAPDFEEKLEFKQSDKAKASHIEYAIRETISEKVALDPAFYGSLQEKLENLIEEDRARRKDEAQLLSDLMKLSKQEDRRKAFAQQLGLEPEEFSFYGKLEPYSKELFFGDDKKRASFAKELLKVVADRKVIDWREREEVQKEMRREIKVFLREHNFPQEKVEMFTRELLDLARVLVK